VNRRLDVLAVLIPTAVLAFAGLGLRDLAGEEIVFYFGLGPLEILRQAVDPASEGAFHAHQPLSYLVRWLVVTIAGEVTPTTLRLHAAAFVCAGAATTWWVASRDASRVAAVVAGLLVGCSPLVVFHGHEASNYAATPFFAALTLAGLVDLRRGVGRGWLLGIGLVGGMCNDFFFGFALLAAAGLTPWRLPEARRAWAWSLGILLPLAAILGWSLSRVPVAKRFAPHLDPGEVAGGGNQGVWLLWSNAEAFFEGYRFYEAIRSPLGAGPLVAVLVVVALLGWRWSGRTVPGMAAVWVGVVTLFGTLALAVVDLRGFTYAQSHGRAFLVGVPAVALLVVTIAPRIGRGSRVLPGLIGAGMLLWQAWTAVPVAFSPPRGLAGAGDILRAEVGPDDYIFGTAVHRMTLRDLPHGLQVSTSFAGCLEDASGLAGYDRVWFLADDWPNFLPACDGSIGLSKAGFGPAVHVPFRMPRLDLRTPAFLPEVHLTRWDRGIEAGSGPYVRRLRIAGGSEAEELHVQLLLHDGVRRDATEALGADGAVFELQMPEGTRIHTVEEVGRRGGLWEVWFPLTGSRSEQVWTLHRPAGWPPSGVLWLLAMLSSLVSAGLYAWPRRSEPAEV
jgi:hypothetical protein